MIDLLLDSEVDIVVANYDLQLVNGSDELAQHLAIRLRFFTNDWFLDITAGIPYYDDFFIKNPNQIRIESLLKDEILGTRGITEITSFSSDFTAQSRRFSVVFEALADQTPINIELELP